MTGYDPARYGSVVGDAYDELYPGDPAETQATVDALAKLAACRPEKSVLELGIGTGRIALGLHQMGVRVVGIDGSESMVAQLRAKPHGDQIEVKIGDYRDAQISEAFAAVALLYNGIFDPRGTDAQVDIFRNAAYHLNVGGCFVVESFVLTDRQRDGEWWMSPRHVASEHVELQFGRYHAQSKMLERTLVHLRPSGLRFLTVTDTYATPGELDLIGRIAGFELKTRWANWHGLPHTESSSRQVSIYELKDSPAVPPAS
jgi:SAM-dependent methyltransferase